MVKEIQEPLSTASVIKDLQAQVKSNGQETKKHGTGLIFDEEPQKHGTGLIFDEDTKNGFKKLERAQAKYENEFNQLLKQNNSNGNINASVFGQMGKAMDKTKTIIVNGKTYDIAPDGKISKEEFVDFKMNLHKIAMEKYKSLCESLNLRNGELPSVDSVEFGEDMDKPNKAVEKRIGGKTFELPPDGKISEDEYINHFMSDIYY